MYWAHLGFCMVKIDIFHGKDRQARQKGAVVTNRRTNASHLQPRKNVISKLFLTDPSIRTTTYFIC